MHCFLFRPEPWLPGSVNAFAIIGPNWASMAGPADRQYQRKSKHWYAGCQQLTPAGVRHVLSGSYENSVSMLLNQPWRSTGCDPGNHRRRRGKLFWVIMWGTWWLSISSWCQPWETKCYSFWWSSHINDAGLCTSMSWSAPPPGGPVSTSSRLFPGIRHRNIYCGIGMLSMGANSRSASKAWVSKRCSQRHEALGRMHLSNAWLAASDEIAWIMSSCWTIVIW